MPRLLAIKGVPLIGLYMRVTEEFAVLGVEDEKAKDYLVEVLDVDFIVTTVMGSELVGALVCGNSNGIVVNSKLSTKELERLGRVAEVKLIDSNVTCLGNVVCVNDRGAIVHPEVDFDETLSEFLDVETAKGTIGGVKTVGMSAVVTNKGGLLNPNASEWEIRKVEDVMKVEVGVGTVNFGVEMVGTGLVANSKGYIAGKDTTGFELGLIEEALGVIE
ncbi:MAG: translation initiation factor IF-6 [Archaeoglobales archaeon]|nr:MAG: translation initiation factor IF-6 [Archaeoglobales archaeon]